MWDVGSASFAIPPSAPLWVSKLSLLALNLILVSSPHSAFLLPSGSGPSWWRSTSLLLRVPSSFPGCHWPLPPAFYNHWSMGPQITLETPIFVLSMTICISRVHPPAWPHTALKLQFLRRLVRNFIGGSLSSGPLVAGLRGCCGPLLSSLTGVMALGQVWVTLWASLISPSKCGRASSPPSSIISPLIGRSSRLYTSPCCIFATQTPPLCEQPLSFILRTTLQPTGLVNWTPHPYRPSTLSLCPSNYLNFSWVVSFRLFMCQRLS